jgi:hypothetical protein
LGAKLSDLITSDYDVINYEAGVDDEVRGKECASCFRLLTFRFFDKNSIYKDGYDPQCGWCKKQSKLSIKEHTARLSEMNYNSEGTRRQRHPDTEFFLEDRPGRAMECSLFLTKLLHAYPALYVKQGGVTVNGVLTDLALYATSGVTKPEWSGQSFRYLGYVTLGVMPEYSVYEFDRRDIMQRCTQIGWRSVLLRFVENNILTEEQCDREFGPPSGGVNSLWYKKLHNHRNAKKIA